VVDGESDDKVFSAGEDLIWRKRSRKRPLELNYSVEVYRFSGPSSRRDLNNSSCKASFELGY